VGFQFSLRVSCVLRSEGFYVGQSANRATNVQKTQSNPTAGGHPQTRLSTRYGWSLAHKELLRLLTGFVFNPAGCPCQKPSSPGGWGDVCGRHITLVGDTKVFSQAYILISQACKKKKSYGSSGSLKAEVVNENTLTTTPGLDLVGAPTLVVVAPAIFAKKKSEQTDRQTDI